MFVGKLVPSLPKPVYMERVVIVLLHVVDRRKNSLYQRLRNLRTIPPPHSAARKALLMQVEGMIDMLYAYVRALFIIGWHVRECHFGCYAIPI